MKTEHCDSGCGEVYAGPIGTFVHSLECHARRTNTQAVERHRQNEAKRQELVDAWNASHDIRDTASVATSVEDVLRTLDTAAAWDPEAHLNSPPATFGANAAVLAWLLRRELERLG